MSIPGENCLGLDAIGLIEVLVDSWEAVKSLSFSRYRHPIPVQERFRANDAERTAIQNGLELRGALSFPFWDAVMLSLFGTSEDVSGLLQRAKFHQDLNESTFWLSTLDIRTGALRSLQRSQSELLALCSQVLLENGEVRHIPLLDFHCPAPKNLSIVVQVCAELFNNRFFVLESGESYHAYGSSLLTTDELLDLLATALCYAPIVDRAFVAHQLRQRYCLLRVMRSDQKVNVPKVVFVSK